MLLAADVSTENTFGFLGVTIAQGRLSQDTDAAMRAGLVLAYVMGRWLRFAKSGFKRSPSESFEQQAPLLLQTPA